MSKKSSILDDLSKKTVAVSSGKGGVGKTTTAVNMAVYCAKKNMRVGLIDLDPLSDISAVLDVEEPESIFTEVFDTGNTDFRSYVRPLFDRLDLIFPTAKLGKNDSLVLLEKLYTRFAAEINASYDILILDLPAGVRYDDNLIFLHYAAHLIIVTNAEPSAHVSAGGYLKSVVECEPDISVYFWHNKFVRLPGQTFDPADVIGNYNKNIGPEERIGDEIRKRVSDIAFIPIDAALDLLQTNPSCALNLLQSILDLSEFMQERRLADLAVDIALSSKSFDLVKYFLLHKERINSVVDCLEEFGDYLKTIIQRDVLFRKRREETLGRTDPLTGWELFTGHERKALEKYLTRVKADGVLLHVNRLILLLERALKQEAEARRDPLSPRPIDYHKPIDAAIGRLLMALSVRYREMGGDIRNSGGLLLFYFSLYKLFQSKTILKIVADFIPRRKNARGMTVRDKHGQIRALVRKSREYDLRFFTLIKTLYPIVYKQLAVVVETFNLRPLLFRDAFGHIQKEAYLTLFSTFIHETVNSGLSVIIGFRRRPAARAFAAGVEALLKRMGVSAPPDEKKIDGEKMKAAGR